MNSAAQLIPIIALLAVLTWFAGYCVVDLARASEVRTLTREMWLLIILITIPIGGMLYLRYGKVR